MHLKSVTIGLLVMSLTLTTHIGLSPVLAEIGKTFPSAGDLAIQIVLNLMGLITVPVMLIVNKIEYYLAKKNIAIIGTVLILAGALAPQILNSRLWMLYVSSAVIGVGLSFVIVISAVLISDYFTGLKKSKIMGFQSVFVSIGGAIIAKGSGLLTGAFGWKSGYLVLLICIPVVIIIIVTVPRGEILSKSKSSEPTHKLPGNIIYFGGLCLIVGIFVATFNINIAMYIDRKGIGNASTAGTVVSVFQIVGVAGGLLFGTCVKFFKRFTIGAAVVLMALGTVAVSISTNFIVLCFGSAIVGFGFAIRNPGANVFATNMVQKSQTAMAVAIVNSTYYAGNFFSPYVVNSIAAFLGDDISNRFIVAAVSLFVIGIVACIKTPATNEQVLDYQNGNSRLGNTHIRDTKNRVFMDK